MFVRPKFDSFLYDVKFGTSVKFTVGVPKK